MQTAVGADEYVTKPFEPRELISRIRAMLRFAAQFSMAKEELENQPLVCGPLKLWRARHRVEINDQPLDLTPTEWDLLVFLMEYPNQVFGRETLLRAVWGVDFFGDSRTVDTHMQRLRAKLDINPNLPRFIHTIRGFGYRLVCVEPEHSLSGDSQS